MKRITSLMCLVILIALCGCASTAQIKKLENRNKNLSTQLGAAEGEITQLKQKIQYLGQINETLDREKGVRIDETSEVRHEARSFVQSQMGALQAFSMNAQLLDYVGGEAINRARTDGKNELLVDLQHPFPAPGMIMGGKVYSKGLSRVAFCVLRKQGKNLIVIWMSQCFNIPKQGLFKVTFDTPVSPKKGDFVGIYCPAAVKIPYDVGTGDTRSTGGPVEVGTKILLSSMNAEGQRTHSFGVVGFLE